MRLLSCVTLGCEVLSCQMSLLMCLRSKDVAQKDSIVITPANPCLADFNCLLAFQSPTLHHSLYMFNACQQLVGHEV